jgi:hypothetical protein
MLDPASLSDRIEIFALWTGFAEPPQAFGRLTIRREENGDWTVLDELAAAQRTVPQEMLVRFICAMHDVATELEPARFGRTADEVDWHFSSCATDGSPTMLVELYLDGREVLRMRTSSNYVHLLPWTVESRNPFENFNPEVSIALAAILPDGWIFKDRLQSSDRVFDSANEMRAAMAKHFDESADRPHETFRTTDDQVECGDEQAGRRAGSRRESCFFKAETKLHCEST